MNKLYLTVFVSLPLAGAPLFAQNSPEALIQHEEDIAHARPGPHDGGGMTTGYSFFRETEGLNLVFKKRVLHPGSSIGYHPHDHDEIYYVQEGEAEVQVNGEWTTVGPGTAILARDGDAHGIRPAGDEDLTIFIFYTRDGR